jgi:hypothetical protein
MSAWWPLVVQLASWPGMVINDMSSVSHDYLGGRHNASRSVEPLFTIAWSLFWPIVVIAAGYASFLVNHGCRVDKLIQGPPMNVFFSGAERR